MWYQDLNDNFFIKTLYKKIPKLINVKIKKIQMLDEGVQVSIIFDMPYYADTPPKKWVKLNNNAIQIELNFFGIVDLSIESTNKDFTGSIEIDVDENELFNVKITGTVNVTIKAESGMIQRLVGYKKELENS